MQHFVSLAKRPAEIAQMSCCSTECTWLCHEITRLWEPSPYHSRCAQSHRDKFSGLNRKHEHWLIKFNDNAVLLHLIRELETTPLLLTCIWKGELLMFPYPASSYKCIIRANKTTWRAFLSSAIIIACLVLQGLGLLSYCRHPIHRSVVTKEVAFTTGNLRWPLPVLIDPSAVQSPG